MISGGLLALIVRGSASELLLPSSGPDASDGSRSPCASASTAIYLAALFCLFATLPIH